MTKTPSKPPLLPWTILSSREIFKDRWFHLRAERCQTGTGAIIDPYYVVHRHDWSCILAVDAEQRAVAVRIWRIGTKAESLELPAGAIDPEDASPADAVRRELLEETGYACGPIIPVARLAVNPANHTNHVHIFAARDARFVQPPHLEPGETMETELMPIAALRAAALTGGVTHSVHVAAILLATDALAKA